MLQRKIGAGHGHDAEHTIAHLECICAERKPRPPLRINIGIATSVPAKARKKTIWKLSTRPPSAFTVANIKVAESAAQTM
jgi:hypothetical protein